MNLILPLSFIFACLFASPFVTSAFGQTPIFENQTHKHNVFLNQDPGVAFFSYTYISFKDWLDKGSGKYFPFNPAPVQTGLAIGNVKTPPVELVDESQYTGAARDFAEVVNDRNKNGRQQLDLKGKTPAQALKDMQDHTYVVELLFDTVIDQPLQKINLLPRQVEALPGKIDVDHAHFEIPGSFVKQALDADDIEFGNIRSDRTYLLSVFDFRNYDCAVLQDGIHYAVKVSDSGRKMYNDSVYMISQIDFNQTADLAGAEKYFGRRPDALIHQTTVYADHFIRGGEIYFAFFNEKGRTRIAMLSSLAMSSKYFVGAKGLLMRQYVLDGVTGSTLGSLTTKVVETKDALSDLLAGAEDDVKHKNACDHGLALGLIRYSQSLFGQFAVTLAK